MYKIIAIACITLSVAFASCKSTSNDNIVDNSANNTMSATIGDSAFSVSGKGVVGVYIDTANYQILNLTGTGTGYVSSVAIAISGFNTSTLKYSVSDTAHVRCMITCLVNGGALSAKSGTLLVSSVNTTHIAGTFTCILTNGTQVTGGKFDVIY